MNPDRRMPDQCSSRARGNRLKQARKLAKLTLKTMSGGAINFNTLGGWEAGRHGGLTEKGALKVIDRLAQEGVTCSTQWLLYGIGDEPSIAATIQPVTEWKTTQEFLTIEKSIILQLHPDFIGMDIQDEAMAPQFNTGDYVCGKPLSEDLLSQAIGQIIIAELDSGETLLRRLLVDTNTQTFTLVASNPQFIESIHHNIRISRWAKVLCHLCHDALYQ